MAKGHGGGGVLAEDGGQNAYRGRERESTGLDFLWWSVKGSWSRLALGYVGLGPECGAI